MSASPADDPSAVLKDDPLLKQVPEVEGYKVLEPCVLYAKVGEGGMGAVYRGRHLNLDIDVAIKCLKNVLAEQSPAFVTRFQREARIAASVHHQNLVQVYDISHKNGVHYLVMEFVKGETARERVTRKKRLSESEACKVLVGAASGLAEAHSQRIVHRDIKPDNILISFDGKVKVSDLGLAKALELDGSPSLTMGVMGTPQYMAPEQWDDAATVGPQADVWALGATFYFLLTGEHAIPGGSMQQIYKKICVDPFPDIRQKLPGISKEVRAILDKCVQRDPKQRYADCRELLRDVGKLNLKDVHQAPLADAESGTLKVPPLLSPPPAETLGHIKVAIQGEEGAKVDLSRHTPVRRPTATELAPPTAPTAATQPMPAPGGMRWALGAAGAIALVALGWWVFVREDREVVASPGESPTPSPNETPHPPPRGVSETPSVGQEDEGLETNGPTLAKATGSTGGAVEPEPEEIEVPVVEPPPPPQPTLALDTLASPYVTEPGVAIKGSVQHARAGIVIASLPSITVPSPVPDAEGHFEARIELPGEGEYAFTISTDGVEGQTFRVVYDATPPVIVPPVIDRRRSTELDLALQVDDSLSQVAAVWIDEPRTDLQAGEGTWTARLTLAEGPNEFVVHARDHAGNESEQTLVAEVDMTAPRLVSTTPEQGVELTPGERSFLLTFDETFATLEANGQSLQEREIARTGVLPQLVSADMTRFTLSWRVTDALGNSGEGSLEWLVRNKPISLFGWEVDPAQGGVSLSGSSNDFICRRHTDPATGIAFVLVEDLRLYVAETEVTVGQFKRWKDAGSQAGGATDDHPVTNVSWREASAFCKEFGYQLPTREEWQQACLARNFGAYCFEGSVKQLPQYAWYAWSSKDRPQDKPKELTAPQPVRQLRPNAFGLFDMHGNVWEWCADDAPEGKKKKAGGYFASKAEDCIAASEASAFNGTKDTGFRPVVAIR